MKLFPYNFQKAVALSAAFLIFEAKLAEAFNGRLNFLDLKKQAESLLQDKKRQEALLLIDDFLKESSNKADIEKAKELKINLGKKFLSQEAQSFYEQSINLTLENKNESKKFIEQCLALEKNNLDCQIQSLRLEYRDTINPSKNKQISAKLDNDLQSFDWIRLTIQKKDKDFKNQVILKKIPTSINETQMILTLLELERSIQSKNYAMAKEALAYFEKNYSDWPEIVLFKQKIDADSSENQVPIYEKNQNQDTLAVYQAKCKSLSKTSVRRFRYDFDLCLRGN